MDDGENARAWRKNSQVRRANGQWKTGRMDWIRCGVMVR